MPSTKKTKKVKKVKKLAVNKLISVKEFIKNMKNVKDQSSVFVFPLPIPMSVGEDLDGNELVATHCVLKDLEGNGSGAVQNCFARIGSDGKIVVIDVREAMEDEMIREASRRKEFVN